MSNINEKLQKQSIQTALSGIEINHLNKLLRERAEFAKYGYLTTEEISNECIDYRNNQIKKLLNL